MIKIIFFDIDGTLLPFGELDLSPKAKNALNKLRKEGIKIVISTGRGARYIPRFKGVKFDAYISFNGSYCFSDKEVIASNPLPKEDVITFINNANKLGKCITLSTTKELLANKIDKDLQLYLDVGKEKPTIVGDLTKYANKEIFLIMMSSPKKDHKAVLKGTHHIKATSWWDKASDFLNINSGKGYGVKSILKYFGLKKSEAMAFGDGSNDIEMFKEVKYGIAMGNASNKVKENATTSCLTVYEDGVYEFLKKYKVI